MSPTWFNHDAGTSAAEPAGDLRGTPYLYLPEYVDMAKLLENIGEARSTVFADLGHGVLDIAMVETAVYCPEAVTEDFLQDVVPSHWCPVQRGRNNCMRCQL
jgi:hypothetical protein